MNYTLADLEAARAELARANRHIDSDRSNNPDQGQADAAIARSRVEVIEAHLRATGALPLAAPSEPTALEMLHARIDAAFPDATSRQVVEFEGRRYRRQFYPRAKSHSGKTVKEWGKTWVPLD